MRMMRALTPPLYAMNHLVFRMDSGLATAANNLNNCLMQCIHIFPPSEAFNIVSRAPRISGTLTGFDTGSAWANQSTKSNLSARCTIRFVSQINAEQFITPYFLIPKHSLTETTLGRAPLDAMAQDFTTATFEYLTDFSAGAVQAYTAPISTGAAGVALAGIAARMSHSYGLTPLMSQTLKEQYLIKKLKPIKLTPGAHKTYSFKLPQTMWNHKDYYVSGTNILRKFSRYLLWSTHGELNQATTEKREVGHGQWAHNFIQSTWWRAHAHPAGIQNPAVGSSNTTNADGVLRIVALATAETTELDLTEAAANVAPA